MVTCEVVEDGQRCGTPVNRETGARGMCARHYSRWKRHGDPLTKLTRHGMTSDERFDAMVERAGDCLLWAGCRMPSGHGQFSDGNGRTVLAHRYAWERAYGPIPQGLQVNHRCPGRHPHCVQVRHMYLGTAAQNNADKATDGTDPKGERHGNARLTRSNVLAIRRDSRGPTEVAAEYGISVTHVSGIRHRRAWAWLDDDDQAG